MVTNQLPFKLPLRFPNIKLSDTALPIRVSPYKKPRTIYLYSNVAFYCAFPILEYALTALSYSFLGLTLLYHISQWFAMLAYHLLCFTTHGFAYSTVYHTILLEETDQKNKEACVFLNISFTMPESASPPSLSAGTAVQGKVYCGSVIVHPQHSPGRHGLSLSLPSMAACAKPSFSEVSTALYSTTNLSQDLNPGPLKTNAKPLQYILLAVSLITLTTGKVGEKIK